MFPGPYVSSSIKIGSVTPEILLPKSLCGGWWGWWVVVCKPILVFTLSLGQAEQKTYMPKHKPFSPRLCLLWCLGLYEFNVNTGLSKFKTLLVPGFVHGMRTSQLFEKQD